MSHMREPQAWQSRKLTVMRCTVQLYRADVSVLKTAVAIAEWRKECRDE